MRTVGLGGAAVATLMCLGLVWVGAVGAADLERGRLVFRKECEVCHGAGGKGNGPLAELLDPRPRNFEEGLFKLRSTESGELPTDDDLVKTISEGMHGTGMPSFRHLGAASIADVVAFVKTLGGPPDEDGSWFDLYEVPPAAAVPPAPPADAEARALAERLYADMGCDGCHGKSGRGDGKKPEELLDQWGRPTHARDFRTGVFKGGNRPEDVYMRILTGLDGTPMTGFWKEVMTPDERWVLVRYVLSFGPRLSLEQPSRGTIAVAEGLSPLGVDDPLWKRASVSRVLRLVLRGGWMRYFAPVEVRAARDGEELAILVSWDDGPNQCASLRVMFPAGASAATFELGSSERPMLVWHWRENEAPGVTASFHPVSAQPRAEAARADAAREGERRRVLLRGKPPESAKQMPLSIGGCSSQGEYETASTFYDLR